MKVRGSIPGNGKEKKKRTAGNLWRAGILSWLLLLGQTAETGWNKAETFAASTPAGVQNREAAEQTVPSQLRQLYARGAVLMDGDSGRILFGKNESEVLPMASTTKIMTCILALELAEGGEICQVSGNAAAQPKVHLGMREGETYYLKDLLYSMMLESHNDSAVCVAEHVGGSAEGFAELMNEKARQIGCENTHYITANGLDGTDTGGAHSTTAADLARVMRYCVMESEKREAFCEITQTASYQFCDVSGKREFSCSNHNALLTMMDGVRSGKTGFTGKAGYCYVGAVEREGKTLIGALLACGWPNHKGYKWADMRKLLDYGFSNFEKRTIDLSSLKLPPVRVRHGVEEQTKVKLAYGNWGHVKPVRERAGNPGEAKSVLTLLAKPEEKVELKIRLPKLREAPVKAGEAAGGLTCLAGGEVMGEFPLVYCRNVERIGYFYCFRKVLEQYFPGSPNV